MATPPKVRCIGVDLAWSPRNYTGLCVLDLDSLQKNLTLLDTDWLRSDAEILEWIEKWSRTNTIVGIDAPIIAPNPPGTGRPCDRHISRDFSKFEAGAYPANREKCKRPIQIRKALDKLGFNVNPTAARKHRGKWQIEVYPHPAQIVLFGLKRTLKYKRGLVAKKRKGLDKLGENIRTKLRDKSPTLISNDLLAEICSIPYLCGKCLKNREDRLDSIVCGYVAAYFWLWGFKKCTMYGDITEGYIITPSLSQT